MTGAGHGAVGGGSGTAREHTGAHTGEVDTHRVRRASVFSINDAMRRPPHATGRAHGNVVERRARAAGHGVFPTLPARLARKSRTRCLAASSPCAIADISDSTNSPSDCAMSAMRGSACVTA